MAEFTWKPSRGFTGEVTPRVKVANFGDGYSQRIVQGINSLNYVWNLQFQQNDINTANSIISFFATKSGSQPFTWLPPGESTEITVVCTKWSKVYDSEISATVSATFEKVYGY